MLLYENETLSYNLERAQYSNTNKNKEYSGARLYLVNGIERTGFVIFLQEK